MTEAIWSILLLIILAPIAWVDYRRHVIPDAFNSILACLGLLYVSSRDPSGIAWAILSALIAVAVFLAIRAAYRWVRGRDGLGLGDVKFMGAATLWSGLEGVPWLVLFASIAALVHVLARHGLESDASGGLSGATRIPFGPYLAVGLLAQWFIDPQNLV